MLTRGVSAVFWLFVAASSIALFPVAVLIWAITNPFDRRKVVLHRFTCAWASLYTWCNPWWRVRVEGLDRIADGRAYVMVANHNSVVDIFVLYRLFRHFKWVSKIENFKLPCIGWNMTLNGYIPLRRGDKQSIVAMLHATEQALLAGNSIMMFPEGTRSKTGELRPFKLGAFELAKRTRSPILPIVLQGTRDALPKHGFTISPASMKITVLPAIEPETFERMPVESLAERVRDLYVEAPAGPAGPAGSGETGAARARGSVGADEVASDRRRQRAADFEPPATAPEPC